MEPPEIADLQRALRRFTHVMGGRYPAWMREFRPGLDDAGLVRLREAVAPYLVPDQVEALYRWHDGGDSGVFGGWRMRPVDELIDWYRFTCEELVSPPTWLPVFEDQIVNVVTLDVPGLPRSDLSVWYGHTHDVWLARLFDSIAAMLDTVCDAAEGDALTQLDGHLGIQGQWFDSLDGDAWKTYRLARSPGTYQHPDPPAGTYIGRHPEPDWPRPWLASLGITDESLTLRGPTHTIAELIEAAAQGPVEGTIRGRVVTGSGDLQVWKPLVDDGSGRIVVVCDKRVAPLSASVGEDGEFDVELAAMATTPSDAAGDPHLAALVDSASPPVAHARAARQLPTTA